MHKQTKNVEETKALAKEWMKQYPNQKLWLLKGDLGAGKTSFVKGIAEHFGADPNKVKSPSFAILEDHGTWIHADLYRLEKEDPLLLEELNEYLKAGYFLFIEWPQRFNAWQNTNRVEIEFTHLGGEERELKLNLLP